MEARDILIRPIVTEKSTALMEQGKYTFRVPLAATMRYEGKLKRMGRTQGRRSDWKKAVVTLKPGEAIELFEG